MAHLKPRLLCCFLLGLAVLLGPTIQAQVPQLLNYQGRVAVGGVNFTGTGSFRFALVDTTGATTYWSNDPTAAVALTVTNGIYAVQLGDTNLANMTAVPASVFTHSDVRLRIWFDDGTHGSQLLAPDQRIAAVGYAIMAGNVPDGTITAAKIAAGAVSSTQLGVGSISGFVTCNVTDPTHTYVYLRGTGTVVYVGDSTPDGYPFKLNYLEPGTYTLVAHVSSGYETTTQVVVTAGQAQTGVSVVVANIAADVNNCGSCGNVCNLGHATSSCSSGACAVASCQPGWSDCNLQTADGCEVHTAADVNNCGSCGNVCNLGHATSSCSSGSCAVASCQTGWADCNLQTEDGCEVHTAADLNNCGSCGNVCNLPNATSSCTSGACGIATCNPGYANCNMMNADGCEVNLQTDPQSCGTCGNACAHGPNSTAVCTNASCGIICSSGYADCDMNPYNGCEVHTTVDVNNCGGCGNVCNLAHATSTCSSGSCALVSCQAGWSDCNLQVIDGCEVNTASDPNNCGACGHSCVSGHACVAGSCQ